MSLLKDIYIERGTIEDWNTLHELHYKADSLGIGPNIYRCMLGDQLIGVGVMTVTRLLLSGRNELFEKYLRPNVNGKDTKMTNRKRALWINSRMTLNSRLVLDTMYRGSGIAYRMQNLMMRMTGKRFIEFQSSMSKYNPFAAKAGIRFTKPRRASNYERGLAWFRRWFESLPTDFVGVMNEINAMPAAMRVKCVDEMRKTYFSFSAMEKTGNNRANGTDRVDGLTTEKLLKSLQQLVFASPLYGVYENPDYDMIADSPVKLPARIPLLAFDNQATDTPLDLSKLN
jgi:ABC-type ATPase with predicted acetyltransferase domain